MYLNKYSKLINDKVLEEKMISDETFYDKVKDICAGKKMVDPTNQIKKPEQRKQTKEWFSKRVNEIKKKTLELDLSARTEVEQSQDQILFEEDQNSKISKSMPVSLQKNVIHFWKDPNINQINLNQMDMSTKLNKFKTNLKQTNKFEKRSKNQWKTKHF